MSCNFFLVMSDRSEDRALVEALLDCQARDLAGIEADRVTFRFWPKSWNQEDPPPPFDEIPASLERRHRHGVLTSNRPSLGRVQESLRRLEGPVVGIIFLTSELIEHRGVLAALMELLEFEKIPMVVAAIEEAPPDPSGVPAFLAGKIIDVHGLPVTAQARAIQTRVANATFEAFRAQSSLAEPTAGGGGCCGEEEPSGEQEMRVATFEESVPFVKRAAAAARLLVTPRHVILRGPPSYYERPEVWEAPRGPMPVVPRGWLSWKWRLRNLAPVRAVRNAWARGGAGLDWVMATVFAPPVAARDESFLIQTVLHLSEQIHEAEGLATTADPATKKRGFKSLTKQIPRGSVINVHLSMEPLKIATPIQTAVWRGEPEPVTFAVRVPPDCPERSITGEATISLGDIPVGVIAFQLSITSAGDPRRYALLPAGDQARTFQFAFISYASEDRPEVLKRV